MSHIYYICSHFTYLVLYYGMRSFFRSYYPDVRQTLVLVEYPFLSLVDGEEFVQGYDAVHRVTYGETAFTTKWRTEYGLGAVKDRLSKIRASLRDSRSFTFEEGSLCFVSEMTETSPVVRLLISKLRRETRHSKLCRVGTCFHRTDECKTNNWLSWLENNFYVLLGAPPVAVKFYGWMLAERRFYSEHRVMDRHLVFSNRWSNNTDYLEIRYPLPSSRPACPSTRQYVLFLDHGTGWLSLFPEMSVDSYIETTNRILRALTELYEGEDVDLLFKRHPRGHEAPYDLAGFEIFENNVTAEMIFIREAQDIRAVYSAVSTAVRTASLFGIPAYIFDELYDLPEEQRHKNGRSLLDFSDVVNIRALDELRLPTPKAEGSGSASEQDLERLALVFRQLMNSKA